MSEAERAMQDIGMADRAATTETNHGDAQRASPASPPNGVVIVGNPYSGRGANGRRVQRLLDGVQANGLNAHVAWAPDERRALLTDPYLAQTCRCVISAGGDGSLADTVNDLATWRGQSALPVATLPMGNENLFARQFGHDAGPEALVRAVLACHSQCVDLGTVNGRCFTLMVSGGFDAEVVHRVASWRAQGESGLRRVNRLSYLPRIGAAVRAYAYPRITLEADDGTTATGCHAFAFNLPQYGMGLPIAPDARPDDGLLTWVVFERPGLAALLSYGLSVRLGRHARRGDVHCGRSRSLRLSATSAAPVQSDGDPVGRTPTRVAVEPGALRVLTMPG